MKTHTQFIIISGMTILILSFMLIQITTAQQINTFGPNGFNEAQPVTRKGTDTPYYGGMIYPEPVYLFGQNSCPFKRRVCFQWFVPRTEIPEHIVIEYVKITFNCLVPQGQTEQLTLDFYSVDGQLSTGLTASEFWNATDGPVPDGARVTTSNNFMTAYFPAGSAFANIVHDALESSNHEYLTIGLKRYPEEYTGLWWLIIGDSVHLEIGWSYETAKITNVVEGVEDWNRLAQGEWESKVRADQVTDFSRAPINVQYTWGDPANPETRFWKYTQLTSGRDQKFQKWDNIATDFKVIKDVSSYQGQPKYLAWSDDLYGTKFLSNIEVDFLHTMPFQFWDPWRVEINPTPPITQTQTPDWVTHTTANGGYQPQNDQTSYGVFTGKDMYDPAYYSVRASKYLDWVQSTDTYIHKPVSTLPLKEHDGVFLWWNNTQGSVNLSDDPSKSDVDYNNKATIFSADNSEITAVYKAHMLSKLNYQPTMRCSQRKIALDNNGFYHSVYESVGEIWYVKSSDHGSSWSGEELVSDLTRQAQRPSITELDGKIFIIYIDGSYVKIKTRLSNGWSQSVFTPISHNMNIIPTPVIKMDYATEWTPDHPMYTLFAVWEDQDVLKYHGWMLDFRYSVPPILIAWQKDSTIRTGITQPYYPSIISYNGAWPSPRFDFSWREGNNIYYRYAAFYSVLDPSTNTYPYIWISQEEIVNDPGEVAVYAPSITHNQLNQPVIAYENLSQPNNYYNRWYSVKTGTSLGWNMTHSMVLVPYTMGYGDPINPSIGAQYTNDVCGSGQTKQGLRVAYHQEWGGNTKVAVLDCPNFYSDYLQITNASFPNMVNYSPSPGNLLEIASSPEVYPDFDYAVRSTNAYLSKSQVTSRVLIKEIRMVDSTSIAAFGVSDLKIIKSNGFSENVNWNPVHDTLIIGRNSTVEGKMRSSSFSTQECSLLVFNKSFYSHLTSRLDPSSSFVLKIINASDNQIIRTVNIPISSFQQDTLLFNTQVMNIGVLPNGMIYFTISIVSDNPNIKAYVRNIFVEEGMMKQGPNNSQLTNNKSIKLFQNYPNPFGAATPASNPSSEISYSLPEASDVKLNVIDALGREVAVLVNEYKEPGMYTVKFNGDNYPSGIYYYRLFAGNNILTRKMCLIK